MLVSGLASARIVPGGYRKDGIGGALAIMMPKNSVKVI
jgi:hypothetical protein